MSMRESEGENKKNDTESKFGDCDKEHSRTVKLSNWSERFRNRRAHESKTNQSIMEWNKK